MDSRQVIEWSVRNEKFNSSFFKTLTLNYKNKLKKHSILQVNQAVQTASSSNSQANQLAQSIYALADSSEHQIFPMPQLFQH